MATRKASNAPKRTSRSTGAKTKVTTVKATKPAKAAQARVVHSVESAPAGKTIVSQSAQRRTSLLDRITNTRLLAAVIAEFVGTFIFAASVLAGSGQPIILMFALGAVVLAVGHISGAYINPALTIAGWATKRIGRLRAISYLAAQTMGAIAALSVVSAFVSQAPVAEPTMFGAGGAIEVFKALPIPEGKEWLVLAAELIGILVFSMAVARATYERDRVLAAVTVGGGLFIGALIAGSLATTIKATTILNPAIAFTLQSFQWSSPSVWWSVAIYLVTSTIGAILGFVIYDLLNRSVEETA